MDCLTLSASAFGVVADGRTDDGPAVAGLIARAATLNKPVRLLFPEDALIRIGTGSDRYAIALDELEGLHIDGQGSTFLLAPDVRFLRARGCRALTVTDLNVDYLEPPTTPGTILSVDLKNKFIDVRLDDPAMAAKLGGPTGQDGEQAFFGMALLDTPYDTTKVYHFYVEAVTTIAPGVVRITNSKTRWAELRRHVKPGQTRIGLPVPGVAHRHGPGALIDIDGCANVSLVQINVWSAPWFAIRLMRNEGRVVLQHVNVRPKPGTKKVLSACRDAIHAKGNRAELLFEDCTLTGLGDDAFNISTHCSRIRSIESPTQIKVSQQFPLQHIPFRVGDTLVMLDPHNNRKLAEQRIVAVEEIPSDRSPHGKRESPWAPASLLTLDRPIGQNVKAGTVAWGRESANPMSTIRRCVIRRSCRLQTPIVIEACDVESLIWLYGADIEGPGPESVIIRESRIKANGLAGGPSHAVVISGWEGSSATAPTESHDAVLQSVKLIDNEIWGAVRVHKALRAEARGNRITHCDDPPIEFKGCVEVIAGP